jgi:nitric oxide reductase large subunit
MIQDTAAFNLEPVSTQKGDMMWVSCPVKMMMMMMMMTKEVKANSNEQPKQAKKGVLLLFITLIMLSAITIAILGILQVTTPCLPEAEIKIWTATKQMTTTTTTAKQCRIGSSGCCCR